MVHLGGLEPSASRLSGVRSNRLSYKCIWRKREDSNLRRTCALNALAGRRIQPTLPLFLNILEGIKTPPFGDPTRTRTWDKLVNSQSLYQLSYGAIWSLWLELNQLTTVLQTVPRPTRVRDIGCGRGTRTLDFKVMSLASWPLDDPAI